MIIGAIFIILVISLILAIRSVNHELSVPSEIKKIKIRKVNPTSGVILFLKRKIVHYSSKSS